MNPDIVPYSHDPPGHTCGLPCCCEDLQIQLRVRRQPRSCIGIQEHDVIQQNFTFKGRLKKQPSLENGFISVQQQKETKRGDIPAFGSVRNQLPTIKEEKLYYNFLKGRGITLPECKDPRETEKVYLQGVSIGESDDVFDVESQSEIEYYMTVPNQSDSCRGVPYTQTGLDKTTLYPWELLKDVKETAKHAETADDRSISNYYEVLIYPEEETEKIPNVTHVKLPEVDKTPKLPTAPPKPPDIPPRLPKQNMFNHPPLTKDTKDSSPPPSTRDESKFPHLEQSKAPLKYNTYNSVHSLNNMANKVSRDAYQRYQSLNRSQQTSRPFHRDARDIDFSGIDNPTRVRPREFTSTLERILQRNDGSTDSLDKEEATEVDRQPGVSKRSLSGSTCAAHVEPDKDLLIEELEEDEEEGITNAGFQNVRIDGKILGSRNSFSECDFDSVTDGVYHRSLRHGEIDGNMLKDVINAAGVTDAGLKYFHIDDIDSDKDPSNGSLDDNPITLIL